MSVNGLWVAEFSGEQGCFNADTLENVIRINTKLVLERKNNGYLIFGIYGTQEEASEACEGMRRKQKASVAT